MLCLFILAELHLAAVITSSFHHDKGDQLLGLHLGMFEVEYSSIGDTAVPLQLQFDFSQLYSLRINLDLTTVHSAQTL